MAVGLDVPDDHEQYGSQVAVFDVESGAPRFNIEQGHGHVSCLNYAPAGDRRAGRDSRRPIIQQRS